MHLEGSCHCKKVTFSVDAPHPYPFNQCYCSICRKTGGGGGYAINIGGEAASLEVSGRENVSIYHAHIDGVESPAERHFCRHCGSALWLWDSRWADLVHPFASAIDSDLPEPPERAHIMLGSKPAWVGVASGDNDKMFDEYPDESLAQWHQRLGLSK